MKEFTCSVSINLPRQKVVELFDNPENMKHWQDGFQSMEHLTGEKGKAGATSKLVYQAGKRRLDMTETIIANDLPERFTGEYTSDHTVNTMENIFTETSPNETKWTAHIKYSYLSFLLKVILFFNGQMFQKQTQKWMNQFRDFAESQA